MPLTSALASPPALSLFSVDFSTATSELFSLVLMFSGETVRQLALQHNWSGFVQNEDGAGLELGGPLIGGVHDFSQEPVGLPKEEKR